MYAKYIELYDGSLETGEGMPVFSTELQKKLQTISQGCLGEQCKACARECLMLEELGSTPGRLFTEVDETGRMDPLIPYSCNLCGKCRKVCPQGFPLQEVFQGIRNELVANNCGPLKQHGPILMHQRFSYSSIFTGSFAAINGKTRTVFFPGCSLSAYYPDAVGKLYRHLGENLDGVGALLTCCGKPTKAIGQQALFKQKLGTVLAEIRSLGAVEVVTACQSCYKILCDYAPEAIPGLSVKSLWVVLDEIGLPKSVFPEHACCGGDKTVAIHDSCVTRDEDSIHHAVRNIVSRLGYGIEEMPNSRSLTRCCGQGGMIVPVNPALAGRVMRRTAESQAEQIVTYCAACKASMTLGGKTGLHIVDLLFRENLQDKSLAKVAGPLTSWLNRWKTKRILAKVTQEIAREKQDLVRQ